MIMNHICRFQQIASSADGDVYVSLIPIIIMMLLNDLGMLPKTCEFAHAFPLIANTNTKQGTVVYCLN